jgi:UDP-N-acetylglucosamine--N-acetylmuramyl-(pentapeptide) pyrophosphoryl-undecaprenol N-acetylglucosamine transferase
LRDEHGATVRFVGARGGLESKLVPEAGFEFHAVDARPLHRELSFRAMLAPLAAARSVRSCLRLVSGADAVVGMGGYVSVPAVVAAIREQRPILLHEQNAVPGLANRVLARFAALVALSFPEAGGRLARRTRVRVTGNPVRDEILRVREERDALAKEALSSFDLEEGRRTVLVLGGSQGALRIDRAVAGATALLRDRSDLQILALTGTAHLGLVKEISVAEGRLVFRAIPYLDRMELAYAVADLAVARAGATSIAEIAACGLPAILVPYPYATARHQAMNASVAAAAGAAAVVSDAELTPQTFVDQVSNLLLDEQRLEAMARAARSWGRPGASDDLARAVVEVAGGRR